MSNKNKILIGIGAVASAFIIIWLIIENKNKGAIINKLEIDKMKLLKDGLKNNPNISDEIKNQIEELIEKYSNINPDIAEELSTALSIINAGNDEKGIGTLALIIENLLTQKYKKSSEFRQWLKRTTDKNIKNVVYDDYIEFAKVDKVFIDEEYYFAKTIKAIRNGTFHKPGKKIDYNFSKAGILVGIGLILKVGEKLQIEGKIK